MCRLLILFLFEGNYSLPNFRPPEEWGDSLIGQFPLSTFVRKIFCLKWLAGEELPWFDFWNGTLSIEDSRAFLQSWGMNSSEVNYSCFSFPVLFGFISVKTELGSRIKSLKLWNKEEREGLFEQEERLNRKKKHKKAQSTKAKNFAEKYSLDESEIFLSPWLLSLW